MAYTHDAPMDTPYDPSVQIPDADDDGSWWWTIVMIFVWPPLIVTLFCIGAFLWLKEDVVEQKLLGRKKPD